MVIMPIFIIYLWEIDTLNFKTIDQEILIEIIYGFLIYLVLSTLLIYDLRRKLKKINFVSKDYVVKRNWVNFFLISSILHLTFLILDGKVNNLLSQSLSSLANDEYSDARVAIVEKGFQNYQASSILNYFKFFIGSGVYFGFILLLNTINTDKIFFGKNSWKIFIIGLIGFFGSLSTLEKGPIVTFLLITVLVYYRAKLADYGVIFVILGFIFINFLGVFLISITANLPYGQAFSFFYFRIFIEPGLSTYMHFAVFPEKVDFVNFSNFNLIKNLFNLAPVLKEGAISNEVAVNFTGNFYSQNANFIATGWAQSGYLGILIYCLIAFAVFYYVDNYTYIKFGLNKLNVLAFFYFFWFLYFANTSIENFLISSGCFYWPVLLRQMIIVRYK